MFCDKAYLFGGNPLTDLLWEFNLKTLSGWKLINPGSGPKPTARFNVWFVYNKEKDLLFLQNGDTASGPNQNTSNQLWSYDPKRNFWNLIKDNALFGRREFAAYATKGDMFTVAMGQLENDSISGKVLIDDQTTEINFSGDKGTNQLLAIDLDTKETLSGWEQLFPLRNIPGLRDLSFTQDDEYLYVLNTGNGNIQFVYNRTIWKISLDELEKTVAIKIPDDDSLY